MTDRKPTAGFWIAMALVAVLVGYPLSFGPACWLYNWRGIGESTIPNAYHPIIWLAERGHSNDPIRWYATSGRCPAMYPAIDDDGKVVWGVDLPERRK